MFLTQMSGAVYPSISPSLLPADTRLLTARVCWKCSFGHRNTLHNSTLHSAGSGSPLELETKAIRRFAKVSIVSYSRPSLMTFASVVEPMDRFTAPKQTHEYLADGSNI